MLFGMIQSDEHDLIVVNFLIDLEVSVVVAWITIITYLLLTYVTVFHLKSIEQTMNRMVSD